MVDAIRLLDLAAVIRFLRRHPSTKALSQTALANMCQISQTTVSYAERGERLVNMRLAYRGLVGLGAPVPRTGDSDPVAKRALVEPPVESDGPQVVVTSPEPVHVEVVEPSERHEHPRMPDATLVADHTGVRLVVTPQASWGVSRESGGTLVWFTINHSTS